MKDDDNQPQTIKVTYSKEHKREKIKDVNSLPSWFKSCNYKDVANLSLIGWYNELALRAEYYSMPFEQKKTYPELYYEDNNNPLSDKSRKHFFGSTCRYGFSFKVSDKLSGNQTQEDRFKKDNFGGDTLRTKADKLQDCSSYHNGQLVFNGLVTNGEYLQEKECISLVDTEIPLIDNQEENFMVNLLCPDEILKERFETWILQKRKSLIDYDFYNQVKESGRISKVSDTEIKIWCDFGLLPFLDLHQWALLEHKKILDKVYQLSIFPNTVTTTDMVKSEKSIKKTTYGRAGTILIRLKVLGQQLKGYNIFSR